MVGFSYDKESANVVIADMVKAYLLKIPANEATGVDGFNCALLRPGIAALAPSIAIELSLSSRTFSCRWKRARVTVLHKLPLNCSKTKTLLIDGPRLRKRLSNEDRKLEIELKGCKLGQVENVKLLGLELDEQLSFDVHINYLCKTI